MAPRAARLRVGVVGLGKAGGALRASLLAAGHTLTAARRRLPARLPPLDVLFLAVPDDALDAVDLALAQTRALPALVVHLSGSRGIDALARTAAQTAVGTFHPLASLDGVRAIPPGTLVAVDASSAVHRTRLMQLARRCRLHPAHVPSSERARYHAGAVVSANLAVALLHEGVQLLVDAGVPPQLARVSLARLLRSQADNAIAHPLARALTGPVARGDAGTLARHVNIIRADPALLALYRDLSTTLIDEVIAQPAAKRRRLRAALA